MEVSWNGGAPKSSMFKRYSIIINHTVFLGYLQLRKHPHHIFPSRIGSPVLNGTGWRWDKIRHFQRGRPTLPKCRYKMSWINNSSADQKYISIYIYPGSSNVHLFLVAAVVAHFCSESTTKSGSVSKCLFLNVFGRTGINTHQIVEFVILWPRMP